MAKQPNWKKTNEQGLDRQNLTTEVAAPKGAESKEITELNGGNMAETVIDSKARKPVDAKKKHAASFTLANLKDMKMSSLRKIGEKLGVKDNIKSELVEKILKASLK